MRRTGAKPRHGVAPYNAGRNDRLPPHSPESEQGVLGCMLIDKQVAVDMAARFRNGGAEFYDLRHQTIFECLVEMVADMEPIDLITLLERLNKRSMLEEVGGMGYVATLPDVVPSSAHAGTYADTVMEKHLLRTAIQVCTETVGVAYAYSGKVDEFIDALERDVLAIRQSHGRKVEGIKELVGQAIDMIERYHQLQGALLGLSTGLLDLDQLTMGLMPADVTVIAGYPSSGKTALAMNIADHVAVDCKIPVGVFSLEMKARQLTVRMISSRARVGIREVQKGHLNAGDFPKLTVAATKIAAAKLFIDDDSDQTIQEIRAKARRLSQQHGVKLFVVDYLQLAKCPGCDSRQEEVAQVSNGFKQAAKETDSHWIVLSQLNDDGKLRESRAIGQDADNVGFLGGDKEAGPGTTEVAPSVLRINKQRNGPAPAALRLTFLKSITRFECAGRISDADLPRQNEVESEYTT